MIEAHSEHHMIVRKYTARFLTPAFLGDAEQNGGWRTPPFKALLRQWWRVAVAQKFRYSHQEIRSIEGALFGNTWLSNDISKSLLRLRIAAKNEMDLGWSPGSQKGVHPEDESSMQMKYVAWGLIGRGGHTPARTAISAAGKGTEGERELKLAFPARHRLLGKYEPEQDLHRTLSLIHHFGTVGSRCRNAWGSMVLLPAEEGSTLMTLAETLRQVPLRPLESALVNSWAASFCSDQEGPLIWESKEAFGSWGKTLLAISKTKKHVRSALQLEPNHFSERHVLGLPVKGSNPLADRDTRMPSPLRYRVFERDKKLAFRVYAMPHGLPDALGLDAGHNAEKPKGMQRKDFAAVAMRAWPKIADLLARGESDVKRIKI